jgi:UDP-N-acetylmuramoyl-tripeptide--D-alanyl-D-alanine ligase
LPSYGKHRILNSLSILAVAKILNANVLAVSESLSKLYPLPGRGEQVTLKIPNGEIKLIDESFNASPVSIKASLEAFSTINVSGKKILVLCQLYDTAKDVLHIFYKELPTLIQQYGIHLVFFCGKSMDLFWQELPKSCRGTYRQTKDLLYEDLIHELNHGDYLMIKGSFRSEARTLVEKLKRNYPTL